MGKFTNFFALVLLIFADSSVAYDVYCQFDGNFPPSCSSFTLSTMTSINEDAVILTQPATYVDNNPYYFQFDSTRTIKYIPTDLFNHFPQVNGFYANQAMLTEVHTNAFINCQHLQSIELTQNPFTNLPASFAGGCYSVQSLNMYQSQVKTIHEDAFRGLFSLMDLQMSNNQIECLPPNLFRDTKGLQSIDFSYNQIKALHPMIFKPLLQASYLNFMMNQISYIPDFDFDFNGWGGQGFYLYLYDNPIIAIDPLFLTHLFYDNNNGMNQMQIEITFGPQSIQYQTCVNPNNPNPMGYDLYNIYGGQYQWYQQNISYTYYTTCYSSFTQEMADNSLVTCGTADLITTSTTKIPNPPPTDSNGTVIICPNDKIARCYLDYLDRYTCVIKGVEGSLNSIYVGEHYLTYTDQNVQRFYFVDSHLSRIPSVLFQKFPNLNYLYIRNAGLGIISDHTFNECGNLKYLDASYNDIIHIDETSLRNCSALEVIDLTGNPLDYISTQLYVYDPSLKTIHFTRNPDFVLG